MAYSMVTTYGMNDKIGNVSFYDPSQENTFQKPFSEETGKIIDEEVRKMIDAAYQRTLGLLTTKKAEVEKLAKELLDKEVLHKSDVEALIGNRPFEEEKVVTFDVEEGKDKITTEETTVADASSIEQVIATTPEQTSVASSEQDSVAITEQTNAEDNTDKPSAA
jgi:cell division protease FtsH